MKRQNAIYKGNRGDSSVIDDFSLLRLLYNLTERLQWNIYLNRQMKTKYKLFMQHGCHGVDYIQIFRS